MHESCVRTDLVMSISDCLEIEGFVRSGLVWRRYESDLMQQLGFEKSSRIKTLLVPYWGINLGSYTRSNKFKIYDLDLGWECAFMAERYLPQGSRFREACDLSTGLPWPERIYLLRHFVVDLVIPVFAALRSQDDVRRMAGNLSAAYRFDKCGGVPMSWMPSQTQERLRSEVWYDEKVLNDGVRLKNGMTRTPK